MTRLYARIYPAYRLYVMLKAILFKDYATCTVAAQGIKFTVEDPTGVQAIAYLQSDIFQTYTFYPPTDGSQSHRFGVRLNTLTLLLAPLAGSEGGQRSGSHTGFLAERTTSMHGSGRARIPTHASAVLELADDEVLHLILEEGGVVTTCRLNNMITDAPITLDISQAPLAYKLIMKSDWLRDTLQNVMDVCDTTIIAADMTDRPPVFYVEAEGMQGSTKIEFTPNIEVVEVFTCTKSLKERYRSSHLRYTMDALMLSTKTSIRANENGMLGLQMMIPIDVTDDRNCMLVEFFILPSIAVL